MARVRLNENALSLHTTVRDEQRAYLRRLALVPGVAGTGTVDELLTAALAGFLTKRPFEHSGWEWKRPEGPYTWVNGRREKNTGWVSIHPRFVDFQIGPSVIESKDLVEQLRKVTALVPRIRSTDSGMSTLLHSFIDWTLTVLYPPERYDMVGSKSSGKPSVDKIFAPIKS